MKPKIIPFILSHAICTILTASDGCCCKEILCEAYTPAFYDMRCDMGLSFSGDFLYWYARETDLPYAETVKAVTRSVSIPQPTNFISPVFINQPSILESAPKSTDYVKIKWNPGFRIGLSWNVSDGWDFSSYWTSYQNHTNGSTTVPPLFFSALRPFVFTTPLFPLDQQGIVPLLADPNAFGFKREGLLFQSMRAHWKLQLNMLDIELGRRYYLSCGLTMRPYAGIRGAWSHSRFTIKGKTNEFEPIPYIDGNLSSAVLLEPGYYVWKTKDGFFHNNWGAGVLAGFQPAFYVTEDFSIYANADFALLWGRYKNQIKRHYLSSFAPTVVGTTLPPVLPRGPFFPDTVFRKKSIKTFFRMSPLLDLALGLRWEGSWCCNRYRLEVSTGWEHHIWFNHNYYMHFTSTDLGLGGLTVRALFAF